MEAIKKMYLVDERTYNNLKPWQAAVVEKYQENAWLKPAEKRTKTEMHRDMHETLENHEMSSDEKAKMYTQQLIRFLNTNKGEEMQPYVIKQEPIEERKPVLSKRARRKQKKQKKVRRSSRQRKPVQWDSIYDG